MRSRRAATMIGTGSSTPTPSLNPRTEKVS